MAGPSLGALLGRYTLAERRQQLDDLDRLFIRGGDRLTTGYLRFYQSLQLLGRVVAVAGPVDGAGGRVDQRAGQLDLFATRSVGSSPRFALKGLGAYW